MSALGIPCLPLTDWDQSIDFVLLAVPDHQLPQVAQLIPNHIPIIYPSGSTDWNEIQSDNKAVLWGIYSFIQDQEIDYSQIPFCWEASNDEMSKLVLTLMQPYQNQLTYTNQQQRTQAHMAAVFSNNFVSSLYQIAFELLEQENLPPHLVIATIQQLADKIKTASPQTLQTGPAKRNDLITLEKHLALLNNSPKQNIYRTLSNYILEKYGHSKL
ncbi:MAG: hypothetical protein RLY35_1754 [Bacteroidota bacterium]